MAENDNRLGAFLRARRARIRPEQVGLPPGAGRRRTPGLRREELATLTGVSVDYLNRLEQGRETNPGNGVLDAIARALLLNEEEHEHLYALARHAARADPPPIRPDHTLRPGILMLLENIRPCPAYVLSRYSDVLAANPEGLALHVGLGEWPAEKRNTVRYLFRDPVTRELFPDWEWLARVTVARIHRLLGEDPGAVELTALIEELREHSREFADLWALHDIATRGSDRRLFRHPAVGDIALESETLYLGDSGLRMTVYQAAPGTADHRALLELARSAGGAPPAAEPAPAAENPGT
ncbi:helix-turn-helix transcriptional regulator [Actinoallomurus sp. NBC_01490]|uniref:helix-turn-helix transcriptional regulator n=1 Tax=Actinoallomurus sp. NBC_01490 TaxID=2903557 RepID=UPI002E371461|nr:helix-turn-helix transcriptional regulator [Actinoallomurus sp. NBC_01490]